jgi:ribosomal protein S18 acetylase RimI-like enzyme
MSLTVRYGDIADAALIADLSRQTFYETFADQNTKKDMDIFLKVQFTKGRLMLEVGKPEHIFLLAYNEDEIAGYAKLRSNRHPEKLKSKNTLEIARLYATKNMIGKGVGNLLMKTSLSIAGNENKEYVWLGVWKENHRAIRFYEKWGFEIFDECDFILGNDLQKDWLMKKKL